MKIEMCTNEFKDMLKVTDRIKDKDLKPASDLLIDNNKIIKTNSESTIIYTIKKNWNQETGSLILPIQTAELIKKLKEDRFTLTDGKIITEKKQISFTKQDDLTVNTYEDIDKIFEVTQKELLRMLEVSYTVAQDEVRPILTGVVFDKNCTCALDGYRMSVRKSDQYNSDSSFVVNGNSLEILKSILKDTTDIVKVYYNNDKIVKFEVGNITLIAECLQGEFFKYNSIIPEDCDNKSIVNPSDMIEEIDFIRTADERGYLETVFTEDKITLKGSQCKQVYNEDSSQKVFEKTQKKLDEEYKEKHSKWLGKKKAYESKNKNKMYSVKEPQRKSAKFKKMYDLVPVNDIKSEITAKNELDKYSNDKDFRIAYNPKYMIEALKLYKDEETVELRMTRPVSPIVITNDINKGLELVLPVRIRA